MTTQAPTTAEPGDEGQPHAAPGRAAGAGSAPGGGLIRRALASWWRDARLLGGTLVTTALAVVAWNAIIPAAWVFGLLVIGLPLSVMLAGIWRQLADVDRRLIAARDGREISVRPQPSPKRSPTDRFAAARRLLTDRRFWLDLLWLGYQATAGLTLAITTVVLPLASIAFWALLAAGARRELVDLFADTDWAWAAALRPVLVAGVVLTLLAIAAVPLAARLQVAIGRLLLFDGGAGSLAGQATTPDDGDAGDGSGRAGAAGAGAGDAFAGWPESILPRISSGDLFAGNVAVVVLAGLMTTGIWALDGADAAFWPVWVWFAGACTIALHLLAIRTRMVAPIVVARDVLLATSVLLTVLWRLAGGGDFWPRWPIAAGAAIYLAVRLGPQGRLWARSAALRERVDELTTSRREVVDTQAREMQRIERDLHDGAQARLVALSMQLGRAEARLAEDGRPEAELVGAARQEALAAIRELRDLARGIAPPILQARGLIAAVQALAERTPVGATVEGSVEPRPPAAVESCAYFVCAEALTNAVKHASGASVHISLTRTGEQLRAVIADDGPGGAAAAGGGLEGLRRRVAALDGQLTIDSPRGAGTCITVEVPCAS